VFEVTHRLEDFLLYMLPNCVCDLNVSAMDYQLHKADSFDTSADGFTLTPCILGDLVR
jgi:hypothetical protein